MTGKTTVEPYPELPFPAVFEPSEVHHLGQYLIRLLKRHFWEPDKIKAMGVEQI